MILELRTQKVTSITLQLYKEAILTLLTAKGTISSKNKMAAKNGFKLKAKIIIKPIRGRIKCLKKIVSKDSFQFAVLIFT